MVAISVYVGFAQSNLNSPTKALESYKLNMTYVKSLSNKADFFFNAENYDEAIRIGKERLLILENILGQDSIEYAIDEAELALYMANTGQYKESILLAESA